MMRTTSKKNEKIVCKYTLSLFVVILYHRCQFVNRKIKLVIWKRNSRLFKSPVSQIDNFSIINFSHKNLCTADSTLEYRNQEARKVEEKIKIIQESIEILKKRNAAELEEDPERTETEDEWISSEKIKPKKPLRMMMTRSQSKKIRNNS